MLTVLYGLAAIGLDVLFIWLLFGARLRTGLRVVLVVIVAAALLACMYEALMSSQSFWTRWNR